ncbi:kelch-like protein 20 [Oscarella lobularis]|uniref:kelch-like protein 20 n=1 Tax=Oscarella lobularis TaxID=121494 RepID=UPI0033134457
MAEAAVFSTEGHTSLLVSALQSFRKSKDLCDVVVVVDGHRFHAHRIVLASISGYFSAMFLGDFAERRQTEIMLHNVDAASVATLIDYAYTGKAQCAVDDVERLYASAHFLQFDDVVTKCSKWLRTRTDSSNCLHLGLFADQYNDSLLMSVCDRTAAVNIVDVAGTDKFLALSADHLRRILALDELGVKDEEEVLHVVSKWVKHDYESREKHTKVLLSLVRLPLIDLEKCEALLMELQVREWVTERVTEDAKSEATASPRTGCQDVLLVFGGDVFGKGWRVGKEGIGEDDYYCIVSNEAMYYDPSQDVWSSFPSLVEPRSRAGLVTVGDVLYAVGGETVHPDCAYSETEDREDHIYPMKTVERYDSKQNRWIADVEPMSHPRRGNEVTSCLGRIFGISPNPKKQHYWVKADDPETKNWLVEAYSPEENRWIPFSSPSECTYRLEDATVAALSDQVYVFYDDGDTFGHIRYDPIEDRWQSFSPAPFSFHRTSETEHNFTVTINDNIYFFSSGAFCASFSSKSEQWSKFSLEPFEWSPWAVGAVGGAGDRDKFYIIFRYGVRVINVDSLSKRALMKSGENYLPGRLMHYGAKFISRNFVLNLM